MRVLSTKDNVRWNSIIKSFPEWDVYFLCEYATSFMKHGDGIPFLFYFENNNKKMCFVAMVKDISECSWGKSCLPKAKYYDMETPYGYGGTLTNVEWTEEEVKEAYKELEDYCILNNIISYFIRFSPWLKNDAQFNKCDILRKEKQTIYIDTSNSNLIFENMDSKNRNMVRKAQKNGIEIFHDSGEHLDEFLDIYTSTMDNNDAEEYYYFNRSYFEYIRDNLKENILFFYSVYNKKIIGSSIFFYNNDFMHYHLSGTYFDYRRLASTNLLIYEAALWGNQRGIKKFHLGGGLNDQDSLFGFKKQFNKNGYLDFYIGRMVFCRDKYEELLKLRKTIEPEFDENNRFLIQYRR